MGPLEYETPRPITSTNDDRGSLRLLAIFHLGLGGVGVLGGVLLWFNFSDDPSLHFVPLFLIAANGILLCSGLFMVYRRAHLFSLIVGAIACLAFPIGTILGAQTLVILLRPGVRAMYKQSQRQRHDPDRQASPTDV